MNNIKEEIEKILDKYNVETIKLIGVNDPSTMYVKEESTGLIEELTTLIDKVRYEGAKEGAEFVSNLWSHDEGTIGRWNEEEIDKFLQSIKEESTALTNAASGRIGTLDISGGEDEVY